VYRTPIAAFNQKVGEFCVERDFERDKPVPNSVRLAGTAAYPPCRDAAADPTMLGFIRLFAKRRTQF
jgi:hypothetical protein